MELPHDEYTSGTGCSTIGANNGFCRKETLDWSCLFLPPLGLERTPDSPASFDQLFGQHLLGLRADFEGSCAYQCQGNDGRIGKGRYWLSSLLLSHAPTARLPKAWLVHR